jgi:phospholipase/carboxylesterase
MALSVVEIEPSEPQRGSVIWLHGIGSSARDFEPVVPALSTPYLRFVFPAAPVRAVTINAGRRMSAWYDILSLGAPAPVESQPDLRESTHELGILIERERERGIASENIVLAGFSQGGAMVLHAGLRNAARLGGILVVSGYLPSAHTLVSEGQPAQRGTPILFCHGRQDTVVPCAGGHLSYSFLQQAGYAVEWAEFDLAHTMSIEEVRFIAGWLALRFQKP